MSDQEQKMSADEALAAKFVTEAAKINDRVRKVVLEFIGHAETAQEAGEAATDARSPLQQEAATLLATCDLFDKPDKGPDSFPAKVYREKMQSDRAKVPSVASSRLSAARRIRDAAMFGKVPRFELVGTTEQGQPDLKPIVGSAADWTDIRKAWMNSEFEHDEATGIDSSVSRLLRHISVKPEDTDEGFNKALMALMAKGLAKGRNVFASTVERVTTFHEVGDK